MGPIDVCAVADLPDGDVVTTNLPGVGQVAVFCTEGAYYALEDRCSHQQAWLSDGFLEGCAVECPLHGSLFDLRTGKPSTPPATAAVRVFVTEVIGERIVVHPQEGP